MKKCKTRYLYLDLLKIMSAIFVVFNHYSYAIVTDSYVSKVAMTIMFVVCKVAVPIFIMTTGALILGKKTDYKEIFTKRIFRIAVPLIVVSAIYCFIFSDGLNISNIGNFVFSLFMQYDVNYSPYWLWYLYTLIALYIMTPFLQKMLRNFKTKDYKMFFLFFVIGLGILNFVVSIFNIFFDISTNFNSGLLNVLFSNIVGLYVFGFYIFNHKITLQVKNTSWIILSLSLIVGLLFSFYGVYYKGGTFDSTTNWWDLFIILSSCSIFILFKYYFEKIKVCSFVDKLINVCSGSSFGVYLIHPLLYDYMLNLPFIKKMLAVNSIVGCLFMVIISFSFLTLLFYLLRKIPILKKFL